METERNKFIGASYLYLERDGKILLLRRFNTGYSDGNYSLAAGHIDQGESPRSCMLREATEEIGITVLSEDLELVHVMSRFVDDGGERLNFFWKCSKWTGEVTNVEPHKCDDLSWFSINDLPDNLVPELKIALASIKKNESYSEFNRN